MSESNFSFPSFLTCPTQVWAKSMWVRGMLSSRCWNFRLTLLKQHHQSPITCHSLKPRSEQIHVKAKDHISPCAFAQLDSLLVTLCQETAIPLYSPFSVTDLVNGKVLYDLLNTPIPLTLRLDHQLPLGS